MEEEEQPVPPSKEVEALSSPSFSGWSFSDDDSERNLEDDEDAVTETPEDSPRLEWWEESERKTKEEKDEMLEEQEALLESFATARKEERNRAASAQPVRVESNLRGHGHVPDCSQSPIGILAKVACIWKAATDRRKSNEGNASCSMNGEGATAVVIVISSNEEE
jgi:hypothetical protein